MGKRKQLVTARKWQEIRVFISSTFRDMHAERDHLVKVVFPELRERLERHRFYLVDIDLRWGVTAKQAENDQVLDLCLDEIDRCRPFFIGILGQRYGWIPHELPDPTLRKYGWILGMTGKSITELEILHGVLRSSTMTQNAMFYFRQDAYLNSVPQAVQDAIYTDGYGAKRDAVRSEIGSFCSQHNAPLRDYACAWGSDEPDPENGITGRIVGLEQFGALVRDDLWSAIAQVHPEILGEPAPPARPGTDDWLVEEQDYHERFIESRLRVYVGRQRIQEQLIDYLESDATQPLLLVGHSGSGKSAILGKLWENWRTQHADEFILPHFVGASGASTSHHSMLRRFCLELQKQYDINKEIPDDSQKLLGAFHEFLEAVPDDRRVVLLVDAVNQLDEIGGAQEMNWLPYDLPPSVKIVVSCIEEAEREESALNALRRRKVPEVAVEPLTDDERFEIVTRIPSVSAKSLDSGQIRLLLDNPATRNPLYLTVALEELRGFGSFEQLDNRIHSFPSAAGEEGVIGLFTQVIERLEREVNTDTVKLVLSSIAASRSGLSERELSELLSRDTGRDCSGDLQVILRQIRPYLLRRGALVDFYHRSFCKATTVCYLQTDEYQEAVHAKLAAYFQATEPSDRRAYELPWQLMKAENWDGLFAVLSDTRLIRQAWSLGPYDVKAYFAATRRNSSHLPQDALQSVLSNPETHLGMLHIAARLLHDLGYLDDALRLRSWEEKNYGKNNDSVNRAVAIGNRALILSEKGEKRQALELLRRQEELCRNHSGAELLDVLAGCLGNQAHIQADWGHLEEALSLHREEERIYRRLDDDSGLQACLGDQSVLLIHQANYDAASGLLEEQERLCRETGHREGLLICIGNQANVCFAQGCYPQAIEGYDKEAALADDIGNRNGVARALSNKANALLEVGRREEAVVLMEDQVAVFREMGADGLLARALVSLSNALADSGESERALVMLREAASIALAAGMTEDVEMALYNQALLFDAKGDCEQAITLLKEAEALCRQLGNDQGLQQTLGALGTALAKAGQLAAALDNFTEQEALCRVGGTVDTLAKCLYHQAGITAEQGDLLQGKRKAQEAFALARDYDFPDVRARIEDLIVQIDAAMGQIGFGVL